MERSMLDYSKNKGFKYRDSISIMYSMLRMLSTKDCTPYELSRYCFILPKKSNDMIRYLQERDIIKTRDDSKFYTLTNKGFRMVDVLTNMKEMIDPNDKILFFVDPIEHMSNVRFE